jgi:hypothetical protein
VESQMLEAGFWQNVLGQARIANARARDLVGMVGMMILGARSS